ncbi:CDGSH iron-sulfur domain-containing protein [Cellulophaga sp. HaHaR_3_176]|uniref:CDGSH iron-sulfur domain-containing protein n=1 Tax=Cellulophaga sp. HaHaR_3_176 TaxID=1942464 RepID=UPI001C1F2FE6|nr:CDGSH iron-sulfur domain-containing protein [Cellulophaga sp. HaHaR_3_176]QWX85056.1 CDGSH iron-sulfur domain-containing protein [Cellulophaga sp. HaHaR_3_176]
MSDKKFSPIAVELEKDKNYSWCTCNHSTNQPFCDGSHKAQNATPPMRFSSDEAKTAHLCTCKLTSNPPYCDGSHKN